MVVERKTLQILIALFLVFEIAVLRAGSTEKTVYDFYSSGNRLYHEGKYDEAISAYGQAIQLDPDYYYARINLGVARAKNKEFKQAIQQFTFCIDENYGNEADRFVFHFNRILAGKESGLTQYTQEDWKTLEKLDPVRAAELRNAKDYIFMDALYSRKRNAVDKDQLFQQNKTSILKEKIVIRKIAGHRKNAQEYQAMGLIEGTLQEVSGILTDYGSYPDFMPNIEKATIRSSTGEEFVVEYILGLPMGMVKKYRLRYWVKNEANRVQIFWKKLPWPGVKLKETVIDTYGQWILEDFPGKDNQVLAYYRIYTDPGKIPLGMGWIVDFLTETSIPDIIKRTRRRVKQMNQ